MRRSPLTYEDFHRYLFGGCHALALVLARRTGWSPVAVIDPEAPPQGGSLASFVAVASAHLLCRTPRGTFVDVRGERADIPRDWGEPVLDLSVKTLARALGIRKALGAPPVDWRDVHRVAREVLACMRLDILNPSDMIRA